MTKINRTPMAAVVNAAFSTSIKDRNEVTTPVVDILRNLATPLAYEYGIFAEHDSRVLKSVLWGLRNEHVSLQYCPDKPLQDEPKEGSLDANDTGKPDEHAVDRAAAFKENEYLQAVIERHLESLRKQVRSDLEEAGSRSVDGGRARFRMVSSKPFGFDDMDTLEDWYVKQLAQVAPHSRRHRQIEQSRETIYLPHISAQEANDAWLSVVHDADGDNRLTKLANREWDSIRTLLLEVGMEQERHDSEMAKLNSELQAVHAKYHDRGTQALYAGPVKAAMAVENTTHRSNINRPVWLLGRKFEAVALLAHVGTPQDILNSHEWRAKESELRAQEAQAKAQEAQAQMMEAQANMMELEANMLLMQTRQQLAAMQQQLMEQQKQFAAMLNPPAPPAPKADKPSKGKSKASKASKSEPFVPLKGANLISSRGKATSWTPRG